MPRSLVVGLFIGGRGSRFGGLPKGNLRHPSGVRLIERLLGVCQSALVDAPAVLVGQSGANDDLGLEMLPDSPSGIGPLGGLRALVAHATEHGREDVIALACDMPYVTAELVRRLADEAREALALAPRQNDRWQTLLARYSTRALPVLDAAIEAREHSLQKVFARLGDQASRLAVSDAELRALHDWDSPEDLAS